MQENFPLFFVVLQVQHLQADLEASKLLVSSLETQLQENIDSVVRQQQAASSEQAAAAQPRKRGSKGPGGAVGWVLRTGATVGGTILAGQAVQHYQAQQPRKEH